MDPHEAFGSRGHGHAYKFFDTREVRKRRAAFQIDLHNNKCQLTTAVIDVNNAFSLTYPQKVKLQASGVVDHDATWKLLELFLIDSRNSKPYIVSNQCKREISNL
ncbi:hypothetical protein M436DRAFT_59479 [Aureobasidium namibiae CBS 147.97]|uniref:Uncharacterized protein n=1 Tax=Aureobasidium namibiae CBS 147.97 TaxID=1043004 RepID=A0A074X125_9PEZI|nr:uncharacterized protein M436DRAFT_59479 [Aureobasidium namibiae CBS 147.97]KEQ77489.1 hypothetical protein M436DRAFT_59479 [Aureobasidium namibiae CBS 147.97]